MNATTAHQQTGWGEVQHWYGLKGSQQTVAVIDSGIAWDHRALGRGFGPGYRVVGGWDFAENDPLPYDDAPAGFHGTHVSGILAADATE
ncbi:MAG: S8 family serine peptidase, partial [bacterium]